MMLSSLHPKIRKKLEEMEKNRQHLCATSAPYAIWEDAIYTIFPESNPSCDNWNATTVSFDPLHCRAFLKITAFSDITPLLRLLAQDGWHLTGNVREQADKSGWAWDMEYKIRDGLKCTGTLYADVPTTNDASVAFSCRRVKVGEKMQAMPVYELICNDAPHVETQP